jgi:phage terminase large subunit-like protein
MKSSDECGIVVVGADTRGEPKDWRAVVLEDASVKGRRPRAGRGRRLAAMERHGADRLVAEVNQGGDLVERLVRMIDPLVPFRAVHATRSKMAAGRAGGGACTSRGGFIMCGVWARWRIRCAG